jgi:hypothetical protein
LLGNAPRLLSSLLYNHTHLFSSHHLSSLFLFYYAPFFLYPKNKTRNLPFMMDHPLRLDYLIMDIFWPVPLKIL